MDIRKIRIELDLNQDELAKKIGVSRGAVASWEATKDPKIPNERNLHKLNKLMRGEL